MGESGMETTAKFCIVWYSVAEKVGLNEAMVLELIRGWLDHNRTNGKNIRDGKVWTYNTLAAWSKQLPILTRSQLSYALKKLRDDGYIETANFNTASFNHTLWYTLTEKGWSLFGVKVVNEHHDDEAKLTNQCKNSTSSISQQYDIDFLPLENRCENISKSIDEQCEIDVRPLRNRCENGAKSMYDHSHTNTNILHNILTNKQTNKITTTTTDTRANLDPEDCDSSETELSLSLPDQKQEPDTDNEGILIPSRFEGRISKAEVKSLTSRYGEERIKNAISCAQSYDSQKHINSLSSFIARAADGRWIADRVITECEEYQEQKVRARDKAADFERRMTDKLISDATSQHKPLESLSPEIARIASAHVPLQRIHGVID